MLIISIILSVLMSGCTDLKLAPVSDDLNDTTPENTCAYESPKVNYPQCPSSTDIPLIRKFDGDESDCLNLPEPLNGLIELGEGCYKGCLKFSGKLKVTGKGASQTLIICEDNSSEAAFSGANADLEVRNISIKSKVRGISFEGSSTIKVSDSAIYDCVKGGIKGCIDEVECNSNVKIANSLISDIKTETAGTVSYGVTTGRGSLEIKDSKLEGFHSFAVAVWGDSELILENTVIENVNGVTGDFYGVGIYTENSDMTLNRVKIENTATSFVYVQNTGGETRKTVLNDLVLLGGTNNSDEQGGLVFDGNIEIELARIYISESGGNGIFGNSVKINAQDIDIEQISSDSTTENGFGIVLFESQVDMKRVVIKETEKSGLLVDGDSHVNIEEFIISGIKSDMVTGEFGLGAAVQDGAVLEMENGIISENRECGIMAVDARLILKNIEIRDILPRQCSENGGCAFAPGVPFGHGISLYSGSELNFGDIFIKNNSNGINAENSYVEKQENGSAFFSGNISAVNAWGIDDTEAFGRAFDNVTFCNNKSILTTDVQPVREGM